MKNKFKMLKVLKFLCVLSIFMLNIGNFIHNQGSLTFSLNLFNINAYSFLLTNDIFYGSLASLTLCLIHDEIQSGDINNLQNVGSSENCYKNCHNCYLHEIFLHMQNEIVRQCSVLASLQGIFYLHFIFNCLHCNDRLKKCIGKKGE